MKVFGCKINEIPTKETKNLGDDPDEEWPYLNDTIRNEV